MSVLLINMPFAQLCWPNLGLSLLQGAIKERGFDCELKNFCFELAERTGYELYDWIAGHFAFVLGGEHLFAKEYFGDRLPATEQFWNEVLLWTEPDLDERDKADYEAVAAAIPDFLDDCMKWIEEKILDDNSGSKCRIVGFTTSYQQAFPSLCLARRIKQRFPDIQICFGGAACEGEMGTELLARFGEIDYVFLGESDLTFPYVVEKILDGSIRNHPLPAGVLAKHARNDSAFLNENDLTVSRLDDLSIPDFDAYFADLARSSFHGKIKPFLFVEASRGCWWGERLQCSFCGLNGHSLRFRCKNPRRIVDELRFMVDRYGIRQASFSDNIFAKEYFETFLPLLKESGIGLEFEFEMKANQKKEQVRKMLDAGLRAAQLGIETFSTSILKFLSKGATARHNLQVVKWYTEGGIEVKWNILYGFPGEDPEEYEKLTALLPLIFHFSPPTAFGRVRVDRFAPYHRNPKSYGIENLRPFRGFRFLYPFDDETLGRLSYYHEFDFADGRNVDDYVGPFLEQLERWESEHARGTLRAFDREDGVLLLTDTRGVAVEFQYRLSGKERELYLFCDTARSRNEISVRFSDFEPALKRWIDQRIMIEVDDRFFALALNIP